MIPSIAEASRILRAGGLVAFPTETVYGLGADATNAAAVRKIFAAKGRPITNPLIAHVAHAEVAQRYAAVWPKPAEVLARQYWPGPLTLVLPKRSSIVDEVSAGLATVGLRVPNHRLALELLRAFDGPIAAPSANRSTRVSPTTAEHVRQELGDAVDLVLDGGPCIVGIESTVLDLSGERPRILRPGMINRAMIEAFIGPIQAHEVTSPAEAPATSPGQHEVHYAPHTPAYRYEPVEACRIIADGSGLITIGDVEVPRRYQGRATLPHDPEAYARYFYATLRSLDEMGLAAIYVQVPPDQPQWAAVRDRIRRATRPIR